MRMFLSAQLTLYLLVDAFNPFAINMYDLIIIFLIVLGLFSIGRSFPSLVFCLEEFLKHML